MARPYYRARTTKQAESKGPVTRYQDGIYNDEQFDTPEEAIDAAAGDRTERDSNKLVKLMDVAGLKALTAKQLETAEQKLFDDHVKTIEESLEETLAKPQPRRWKRSA